MSIVSRYVGGSMVAKFAIAVMCAATLYAESPQETQTSHLVSRTIERLPSYGVFDFIGFNVDKGVVTLGGFAYQNSVRSDAARAAKRLPGVGEVSNRIEVLPVSPNDDRIRWATFLKLYTDPTLSRYSPGGALGAWTAAYQAARYPGIQPFGNYPIHIVVKNGRTTLYGIVGSEFDKRIAEVRAREIQGAFSVENQVQVDED